VSGRWPLPSSPGDEWVERPVLGEGAVEQVRLRLVRQGARTVAVDEDGRVWCHGCFELVDVDELSRPGNGHPVGVAIGGH
jgi:hypothetical protein